MQPQVRQAVDRISDARKSGDGDFASVALTDLETLRAFAGGGELPRQYTEREVRRSIRLTRRARARVAVTRAELDDLLTKCEPAEPPPPAPEPDADSEGGEP